MSTESDYLDWRRKPAVGCMFARFLAARYGDHPQRIVSVPTGRGAVRAAADLATKVEMLVSDPEVSAATILLPGISDLEEAARVMLGLRDHAQWSVTTGMLAPPPPQQMVTMHIARQIPFGSGTCPSEALVLGPYVEFPTTRRAPITALEIFVGVPLDNDPKTGTPTVKANLAHIELESLPAATFDKLWERSIEGRKGSLGGDDNRAKAKVSMVVPLVMAQQLGCLP
ncbi:hypothetical protein [Reyranella sp.]|uniref:hypothetical protein n=1 Tax=Reyranella sp. TaxID=1929291 RepID=UPI003BAD917A